MPPATDTDLAFASISQVAGLFRKRKLGPVELTKLILSRIEQLNPQLNAFITVTGDLALTQAKQAERELLTRNTKLRRDRGPLHGIPISLKDNIYSESIRTTAGSKILKDFIPQHDAALVTQLKAAGAVFVGKTNLHEFAYGVTSNNPHFGPVKNPWNLACIPGGSSGGSAAAVVAGLCYGSIGTDTGGSIRIPASLCGIVGLKTTLGRVSVDGVIPLSPKLDCAGPLARTVHDTALLLEPILPRLKSASSPHALAKSLAKPRKFRLGIPANFFLDVLSQDVGSVFQEALRVLKDVGVRMKEVALPLLKETEDAGNQIAWPEATLYHQQSGWFPTRAADYGDDVRSRLEMGTKVAATTYLSALEFREKFIQQLHRTLEDNGVDALVYPTTPIAAPQIGQETIRISNAVSRSRGSAANVSAPHSDSGSSDHPTRALLLRNNRPANLAGAPAISVPCGLTPEGLPVGLQFLSAANDEHLLLQLGFTFERGQPRSRRPEIAIL